MMQKASITVTILKANKGNINEMLPKNFWNQFYILVKLPPPGLNSLFLKYISFPTSGCVKSERVRLVKKEQRQTANRSICWVNSEVKLRTKLEVDSAIGTAHTAL